MEMLFFLLRGVFRAFVWVNAAGDFGDAWVRNVSGFENRMFSFNFLFLLRSVLLMTAAILNLNHRLKAYKYVYADCKASVFYKPFV